MEEAPCNKLEVPDCVQCSCSLLRSKATIDGLLIRLENNEATPKELIKMYKNLRECIQEAIEAHQNAYFEALRQHAEQLKQWAICAPPNQAPLETVPWKVGLETEHIHPKGELTKRTADSVPTTQKKKKK